MPLNLISGGPDAVRLFFESRAVGFNRGRGIWFQRGILSPGAYLNNRALPSHPSKWNTVLELLLSQLALWEDYDGIASIATGGIAHGVALARVLGVPHFIVKKQPKNHGLGGLIDGDVKLLSGMRLVLAEDMSSTFESSLDAMKIIEHEKAKVAHTLLLNTWGLPAFNRNAEPYSVFALCTGEMFLGYAVQDGKVDDAYHKILKHWLEDPDDQSWVDDTWVIPPKPQKD